MITGFALLDPLSSSDSHVVSSNTTVTTIYKVSHPTAGRSVTWFGRGLGCGKAGDLLGEVGWKIPGQVVGGFKVSARFVTNNELAVVGVSPQHVAEKVDIGELVVTMKCRRSCCRRSRRADDVRPSRKVVH